MAGGSNDQSEEVHESFALMCNDALDKVRTQDEAFTAVMSATAAAAVAEKTTPGKVQPRRADAGDADVVTVATAAAEVAEEEVQESFALMCDEAQHLLRTAEEASEVALAAAEMEAYDVFDQPRGEEARPCSTLFFFSSTWASLRCQVRIPEWLQGTNGL